MNKDVEEFVKPGSEAEELARAMDFEALPRHCYVALDEFIKAIEAISANETPDKKH